MKGLQEAPGLQLLAAAVGNISYATLTVGRVGKGRAGEVRHKHVSVNMYVSKRMQHNKTLEPLLLVNILLYKFALLIEATNIYRLICLLNRRCKKLLTIKIESRIEINLIELEIRMLF